MNTPSREPNTDRTDRDNYHVRELAQLRLTLRSDLRFTPHFEGGVECYLIEDALRGQYYRIGVAEYLLISMFDGSTTVGEAVTRLAQADSDRALTQAEATSICKWLVDLELAFTPESTRSDRLKQCASDQAVRKRLGALNPLCMKVPLTNPNRFFAGLTPFLRPCFGPVAFVLGLAVGAFALCRVASASDQFLNAFDGIYSPSRWIWMIVCWMILKVVHESAHAVTCRKYGGSVNEAGLIFVLFAPLAYVDLTSSWRFRSKWHRIFTAAAGMYVELWIASLAAIAWSFTSAGLVNDMCFNLVLMASASTILFNANPLMRFDGYYILSDLFEIPNLYGDGQKYLQYIGQRYVWGSKIQSPMSWTPREVFIRVYGVAALVWRVVICASLVAAAAALFHGLGLVLAVVALLMWVGVPVVRCVKQLCRRDGLQRRRQFRLAVAAIAFVGLGIAVLRLDWPGATKAPTIVQYEPLTYVRASTEGFVEEIFVNSGQHVEAGDPIARLENRVVVAELRDLELAIEQSRLKSRVHKQKDDMHSYQAEMEQLRARQQKWALKRKQVDGLTLRADTPGRVVKRDLATILGTYLKEGDALVAIGDENRKELKIALSQSHFEQFKSRIGCQVHVRLSGGLRLTSRIKQIDPRATTRAPHESMYAAMGGRLESRKMEKATGKDPGFELLAPHFTAVAELTASQSETLRAGQRGVVWIDAPQQTVGGFLRRELREALPTNLRWIEEGLTLGSY